MRKIFYFFVAGLCFSGQIWAQNFQNNMYSTAEIISQTNALRKKIDFLQEKGYVLSRKIPEAFLREAYNMVYNEINGDGFTLYVFEEDAVIYTVVYALNNKNDPNYFVIAHFIIGNTIYWFFKVNFFLEQVAEKSWEDGNGSKIRWKVFY
jgi:hypothetical protein